MGLGQELVPVYDFTSEFKKYDFHIQQGKYFLSGLIIGVGNAVRSIRDSGCGNSGSWLGSDLCR